MLQTQNLDDLTFRQLMEEAQQTLMRYASEWSGANTHDPGIMLLELVAWITEMQQYYVSEKPNAQAAFPLLGIEPASAQPADCVVSFMPRSQAVRLPQGTRCLAQGVPFETVQPTWCDALQIHTVKTDAASYSMQEAPAVFPFGQRPRGGETCSFLLKAPLLPQTDYRIWLTVRLGQGERRAGQPPRLAAVQWDYLTTHGYQPLHETDDTMGFTQSGMLGLRLPTPMAQNETGAYVLRVRLLKQAYEAPPCITQLLPCAARLTQQETLCEDLVLTQNGAAYQADSFLAQTQESLLYEETHGVYRRVRTFERQVQADGTVQYLVPPSPDIRLHALSADKAYLPWRRLGSADGFANQSYRVQVQDASVTREGFSLLVFEEASLDIGTKWVPVPSFHASNPDSRHFLLDCDTGEITFGDGIYGAMPRGEVIVASMALTKGAQGNIAAHQIESVLYGGEQCLVYQPAPAQGGCAAQTSTQALAAWREEIHCAATAQDIRQLVLRTPGLMIEDVNVYVLHTPWEALDEVSHIGIVVKPYGTPKPLSDAYQTHIRAYLEPYRMLGTRFHILSPKYAYVSLTVELEAYPRDYALIERLEEALESFFMERCHVFGAQIRRMELVRFLLTQEGVLRIASLEYEVSDDMIQEKKQNGDCVLRADAIAQVRQVTVLMR